jgi:hypothetical protein
MDFLAGILSLLLIIYIIFVGFIVDNVEADLTKLAKYEGYIVTDQNDFFDNYKVYDQTFKSSHYISTCELFEKHIQVGDTIRVAKIRKELGW